MLCFLLFNYFRNANLHKTSSGGSLCLDIIIGSATGGVILLIVIIVSCIFLSKGKTPKKRYTNQGLKFIMLIASVHFFFFWCYWVDHGFPFSLFSSPFTVFLTACLLLAPCNFWVSACHGHIFPSQKDTFILGEHCNRSCTLLHIFWTWRSYKWLREENLFWLLWSGLLW